MRKTDGVFIYLPSRSSLLLRMLNSDLPLDPFRIEVVIGYQVWTHCPQKSQKICGFQYNLELIKRHHFGYVAGHSLTIFRQPAGMGNAAMINTEDFDVEARRASRTNLFLGGTIESAAGRFIVRIRNISSKGALIQGQLPSESRALTLAHGSSSIEGKIVWRSRDKAGFEFDHEINVAEWTGKQSEQQNRVDQMMRAIQSGQGPQGLVADESRKVAEPDRLHLRIAEELAYASRKLDALANALAEDRLVVMRHETQLQDLDILAQTLGHLERLLASDEPEAVIEKIGMQELKRRLTR